MNTENEIEDRLDEKRDEELNTLLRGLVSFSKVIKVAKRVDDEDWENERYDYVQSNLIGNPVITIWYNDTFGWAYSYCLSIPVEAKTIDGAIEIFKHFVKREDVQKILSKYDEVPYPVYHRDVGAKYGSYGTRSDGKSNLDYFFETNCEIHIEFLEKLKEFNEYCAKFMEYEKDGI